MRLNGMGIRLSLAAFLALTPIAVPSARAQDCVRVVRSISDFTIQGDAWMWWTRAEGRYARADAPRDGSVLVFKRTGRLGRGHVSLVSSLIDRRTIEVDHSWLDGRGLRRAMRVVDVSASNDWSQVRVWHEPSGTLGQHVYPTYGFILPDGARPRYEEPAIRYAVAPAGRSARPAARQQVAASRKPTPLPATAMVAVPAKADDASSVLPRRKPTSREAVAQAPARKPTLLAMAQHTPQRKPQ